jgi:hypothetical protein
VQYTKGALCAQTTAIRLVKRLALTVSKKSRDSLEARPKHILEYERGRGCLKRRGGGRGGQLLKRF